MTIGFVLIRPQTRCAPLPLVGRGWGWGSVLVHALRATTTTPTPPAFAALRRATLPTRGGGKTEFVAGVVCLVGITLAPLFQQPFSFPRGVFFPRVLLFPFASPPIQ